MLYIKHIRNEGEKLPHTDRNNKEKPRSVLECVFSRNTETLEPVYLKLTKYKLRERCHVRHITSHEGKIKKVCRKSNVDMAAKI